MLAYRELHKLLPRHLKGRPLGTHLDSQGQCRERRSGRQPAKGIISFPICLHMDGLALTREDSLDEPFELGVSRDKVRLAIELDEGARTRRCRQPHHAL